MNGNDLADPGNKPPMPPIIYGTAWKKERTAALVEQALNLGFRGIDTACQPKHYNEAGAGAGVAACLNRGLKREELYLQSKYTPIGGHDPRQIPYDPSANLTEQVAQSFRHSLDNLQTPYLDCLILHSPLAKQQQFLEVWRAMEEICRSGKAKWLGISNCYDLKQLEFLYRNAEIIPAVIQNRFYAETIYDHDLREFCREQRIIYQSFWTLTANPDILSSDTITEIAGLYRRSPAQIFFRYLTQIGIVPLTGTTSEKHMQDDLSIFDFELNKEDCTNIAALL